MATVTPNFNWPVPTSTDLVRDGATAIEALGDSIDASLVDLKGGTTGQVLAKASGTDMDFSWVAQDDTNAIQNTIVDAKGDLIAASAADTPARLAVGNNGETLVADSSATTGLRYTAGTVQSNPVLNAAFQVWQRGTSFTGTNSGYGPDRWSCYRASGAGSTFTRQLTSDTTNLPNIQYCLRAQRNAGDTATGDIYAYQSFETVNSIPYAGKTVTFSFYARKGANFSGGSSSIGAELSSGTGTDQNLNGGLTGNFLVAGGTTVITTTWQRFTYTGTVPTNSTQLVPNFRYGPSGTAGAADYFEITGVQIDVGSVALPFRTYAATLAGELAACQRYYQRFYQTGSGSGDYPYGMGVGSGGTGTFVVAYIQFPVPMRTQVSATIDYSGINVLDGTNARITVTSLTMGQAGSTSANVTAQVASGITQYRTYFLNSNNNNTGYIGFSAEL